MYWAKREGPNQVRVIAGSAASAAACPELTRAAAWAA
jgi:hypothetical protein